MNKTIKSGLSLHRLVCDAPIERLVEFFRSSEYGDVVFEDLLIAELPEAELRTRLHDAAAEMDVGRQRRLEDEAARVFAVASHGDWALNHAVRDELSMSAQAVFGQQKDPLGRSL